MWKNMSQEKLEKEIEKLDNIRTGLKAKYEEKKKELRNRRKYIDYLILNSYNEGEIADMFDLRTLDYHEKVRKSFLNLEGVYPGIVKIIDVSTEDIETIHNKIIKTIEKI